MTFGKMIIGQVGVVCINRDKKQIGFFGHRIFSRLLPNVFWPWSKFKKLLEVLIWHEIRKNIVVSTTTFKEMKHYVIEYSIFVYHVKSWLSLVLFFVSCCHAILRKWIFLFCIWGGERLCSPRKIIMAPISELPNRFMMA